MDHTYRTQQEALVHLSFAVDLDPSRAAGVTDKDVREVEQLMSDVVSLALTIRPERRGSVRDQLVELLVGGISLTPVDMKQARLEAKALLAIRGGAEWLTAAEVAELAGLGPANPIGTVSRWKQQGRIFALRQGGKDFYPRYALGADFHPLPVIKELLAALAGYDAERLAAWFESSSRFLDGKRPREVVATEPANVLAAARNMIEVQEHHG
jgi:hypothetical protein